MTDYSRTSQFPVSLERLFAYHCRPGAIDRLIPPWERIDIEKRNNGLEVGEQVLLAQRKLGLTLKWLAEHIEYEPNRLFVDKQLAGPFQSWLHEHRFDGDSNTSALTDSVHYAPPLGIQFPPLTRWLHNQIDSMFRYRHAVTFQDLVLDSFLCSRFGTEKLRVGLTGSSGLIGKRICALASVLGHEVVRIERPNSKHISSSALGDRVLFDREKGFDSPEVVENLDAIIHLGGENIASKRWSATVKQSILRSRTVGSRNLISHLARLDAPPKRFVAASGVGYYGEQQTDVCTEDTGPGDGFLASMATQWEEASLSFDAIPCRSESATDSNTILPSSKCVPASRVAIVRLGMVLHPSAGALAKMLPLFRVGLAGPLGKGTQYWNWIHVDDAASIFLFLSYAQSPSGVFNGVAPHVPTNSEFTRSLGRYLHRPTILPAPAFGLRLMLGEMADELLLSSIRAVPSKLEAIGFPYRARTLESAWELLLP